MGSRTAAELICQCARNRNFASPAGVWPRREGQFLQVDPTRFRKTTASTCKRSKKRSFISSTNLADAICWALSAQPGTYLPSDGDDKSTPELITAIAEALGIKPSLFCCPVSLLRIAGGLTGKSSVIQRLTGSLTVDNNLPGWHPPIPLKEVLFKPFNGIRTIT